MKAALLFLWNSRTTFIGYAGVILGVLAATDGIFSAHTVKVILLINGIVTACVGHFNNMRIRQAAANADPAP